jgi:hypothetical protein
MIARYSRRPHPNLASAGETESKHGYVAGRDYCPEPPPHRVHKTSFVFINLGWKTQNDGDISSARR